MSIEQTTSFTKVLSARKVCILNLDDKNYEEEFKGEKIVIPGNGKRSVFMPVWKARSFLASCAFPPATDYTGEPIKGGKVKMLRISDLTDDEREALGEMTQEELQARQAKADESLKNRCGMCDFEAKSEAGLKAHNTRIHPEAVPVE